MEFTIKRFLEFIPCSYEPEYSMFAPTKLKLPYLNWNQISRY